jgi:hypothetical protein
MHVFEESGRRMRRPETTLERWVSEQVAANGHVGAHHLELYERSGSPLIEIADIANEIGADLIVVGEQPHRPTLKQALLGSAWKQMSVHARCPVIVVELPSVSRVPDVDPSRPRGFKRLTRPVKLRRESSWR